MVFIDMKGLLYLFFIKNVLPNLQQLDDSKMRFNGYLNSFTFSFQFLFLLICQYLGVTQIYVLHLKVSYF